MAKIDISITNAEVQQALAELLQRIAQPRAVFAAIAQELATLTELRFQDEGPGWARLTPRTVAARGGAAHPILQVTGALARSFSSQAGDDFAVVGSNVPYAAIHQFGGNITMPARPQTLYFKQDKSGAIGNRFVKKNTSNFAQDVSRRAYTVTLPARPMLPIDADGKLTGTAAASIMGIFKNYLLQ